MDQKKLDKILLITTITNDINNTKKALSFGANVNAQGGIYSQTPLLLSILGGNFEIAKYLLENGADINATSYSGRGVVDYALHHDDVEFLKYLFAKGILVENLKYRDNFLLQALKSNKLQMAEVLIQNGIDMEKPNEFGHTVISYAIKSKNNELFFKALKNSNLDEKMNYELFDDKSCRSKNKEWMKKTKDFSLLHLAAKYGTKEMIDALINTKKFDIEEMTQEFYKYSPVAIASYYKNYDTFVALFKNGANIYKRFTSLGQYGGGLGYWLGGGSVYTPLGLSIAGENADLQTDIAEFIISQKDFAKMVPLEDETFYYNFSVLALNMPESIYAKVLQKLDENGFQKSATLQKNLQTLKENSTKPTTQNTKETNHKLFRLIASCDKDESNIIPYIKSNKLNLKNIHKNTGYYELPLLMEVVSQRCSSTLAKELIALGADTEEKLDGVSLLERIFTVGISPNHHGLVEYLTKNTNQAKKAFTSNDLFGSFLYSAYDETELFDRFIANGAKLDASKISYYLEQPKSKELCFKVLDYFKNTIKTKEVEQIALDIFSSKDPDKENIEHLMEYASLHKIPYDPTLIMYKAVYANKMDVANSAILLGADKNFTYDGVDSCQMVVARSDTPKHIVEFFCQDKPKTVGTK